MMLAKVRSAAIQGIEAVPVDVEVSLARGTLARATTVGLPAPSARESFARVRPALFNSGFFAPRKRMTINLAPAILSKVGSAYDLPLALCIMLATGQLEADLSDALVLGELSLSGQVRHARGLLPAALLARKLGLRRLFAPAASAPIAAILPDIEVYPVESLARLVAHLRGERPIQALVPPGTSDLQAPQKQCDKDFADIEGHARAKRALEIAVAGGHNVLLEGTAGSSTSALARATESILPGLSPSELVEVLAVYSALDLTPSACPSTYRRPFRAPHPRISEAGLLGSTASLAPGEVTLAAHGILFLDGLISYGRSLLDGLRQPLEDRTITLTNSQGSATLPAGFMLLATVDACPCGNAGDGCICTRGAIKRHRSHLSGPFLDRMDIHITLSADDGRPSSYDRPEESSAEIRRRVAAARRIQHSRFEHLPRITCNSEMDIVELEMFCRTDDVGQALLKNAISRDHHSARVYHRVLKVARTIADLDGKAAINSSHVAEALQYLPPHRV
jgi:magnesium chelatase family protein